jgi:hypothetical protein
VVAGDVGGVVGMRYRVCVALYAEVMEGKSVTSKIRWRAVSKSE